MCALVTDLDPAALRRTAEAARPGSWKVDDDGRGMRVWIITADPPETAADLIVQMDRGANADHIATFDPPTVVALLDALASQREALELIEANAYREDGRDDFFLKAARDGLGRSRSLDALKAKEAAKNA